MGMATWEVLIFLCLYPINGEKRLMPVTLQFGIVKIYQSGMFAIVDSLLAIQINYDCSHRFHLPTKYSTGSRPVGGGN